jgi:hypothetical protein
MQQVFANIVRAALAPRSAAGARLCREMFPTYFRSREEEQDVPIEEPPRGTRRSLSESDRQLRTWGFK